MALLPPGKYQGKVVSSSVGTSRQKQTPYIEVDFALLNGADDSGERRSITFYLTESTIERVKGELESLGWNGDFEAPTFNMEKVYSLYMKYEVYNNKDQERWNLSKNGTIDADAKAKLKALFGQRIPPKPIVASVPPPTTPMKPPTVSVPPAVSRPPSVNSDPPATEASTWAMFEKVFGEAAASQWEDRVGAVVRAKGYPSTDFKQSDWAELANSITGIGIPV